MPKEERLSKGEESKKRKTKRQKHVKKKKILKNKEEGVLNKTKLRRRQRR
jgi:hypothetical protein